MRQVRITYVDEGVTRTITVPLKEAAFGTELHGHVISATFGEWVDESDGSAFPSEHTNRVSRSMTRGTPIFGTGRTR